MPNIEYFRINYLRPPLNFDNIEGPFNIFLEFKKHSLIAICYMEMSVVWLFYYLHKLLKAFKTYVVYVLHIMC